MLRLFRYLLPMVALAAVFPLAAAGSHGSADDASPNMLHAANLPTPTEFLWPANCNRGVAPAPPTSCHNSDLAFWNAGGLKGGFKKILAQGNYEGLRLVDIADPRNPRNISVLECRTNQGDVSFYKARKRLLLIQSIEEAVSSPDCATARENLIVAGTNPATGLPGMFRLKGHEGLRVFDVTDPRSPTHIATVRTACGSHTHTTINDEENDRAIVYVSSYPNANRVTRREDLNTLPEQPNCIPDHNKISIVEIPDRNPEGARVLKEQPLDQDTATFTAVASGGSSVRGCHDITVYEITRGDDDDHRGKDDDGRRGRDDDDHRGRNNDDRGPTRIAAGACLSEGQIWDVSDPANPTTNVAGRHTHIRNPFIDGPTPPQRGLFHTASFTWDGKVILFTDEWQGGGAHGCDGPQDTRGNVWFYEAVEPGQPAGLYGRFILPRPQPATEACTMHNGNVIPTEKGYYGVSSAYQAGTTVFDFSNVRSFPKIFLPFVDRTTLPVPPTVATEIAFFDAKNDPSGPVGIDDAWSTYWHNNYIYASSGLPGPPPTPPAVCCVRPGQRGLDVYFLLGRRGRLVPPVTDPTARGVRQFRAEKLPYQNPQTQEVRGERDHDDDDD
jgi:hypothetical protein